MSLGLDICKIFQSRWVSVSTSIEFFSLDESRSRQILWYQSRTKFSGLVLYSLDNFCFGLDVFVVSVSVSTLRLKPFQSRSRSRHWDSDLFSLGLGLVIETHTFSVSVSVSSLRPRPFQSRSRSRHWDSDIFSLGLGLVIETQTFSVSVSMIQIWSRWSLSWPIFFGDHFLWNFLLA